MKSLVTIENVTKQYAQSSGEVFALRNVSIEIPRGQKLAIVGKSGSGKSTLLNMMTGIDHPSSGRIIIGDTIVHDLNETQLATWRGANIGIVFQFFQLIPTLTVIENILLAMDFVNTIPKTKRATRANELLALVGIASHANKYPASLSGGEQQRAAIARALANNPPVVIADEPTGNLDSQTTSDIQNLFVQLANSGTTIIVVTHDDVQGAGYDRVVTMKDGTVVNDEVLRA